MSIKEKSGVESETCEESKTNLKLFLKQKLLREKIRLDRKKREKRRTIIEKFLNFKQCEKALNNYKELRIWEDQFYINEDFSKYIIKKREFCLNVQRRLGKEVSLSKLHITGWFCISSTCSI